MLLILQGGSVVVEQRWTSVCQVRVSTVERALISSMDTAAHARTVTLAPTAHDVRTRSAVIAITSVVML